MGIKIEKWINSSGEEVFDIKGLVMGIICVNRKELRELLTEIERVI